MAKPREREMCWSLKVGFKHSHFHECLTRVIPYMEICLDRLSSLTREFYVLFNIVNINTGTCLKYVVIKNPQNIQYSDPKR